MIQPSFQLRYLGVWLDPKLIWVTHIKQIFQKVSERLCKARSICKMFWGIFRETMRLFHKCAVLPSFGYAALCWCDISAFKIQNLRRLQKRALLLITGAMKTTTTSVLEIESQILPLEMHLRKKVFKSYLRMQKYRDHKFSSQWLSKWSVNQPTGRHRSPIPQAIVWAYEMIPELNLIEPSPPQSPPWDRDNLSDRFRTKSRT